MSEFVKFPLSMTHPHARKGQAIPIPGTERHDALGRVINCDYQGTPDFMPPVLVHNDDEREYYESQGYRVNGTMDAKAFEALVAVPEPPVQEVIEFPKWVGHVLVQNAEEEKALKMIKVAHAELDAKEAPLRNRGGRPRKTDQHPN